MPVVVASERTVSRTRKVFTIDPEDINLPDFAESPRQTKKLKQSRETDEVEQFEEVVLPFKATPYSRWRHEGPPILEYKDVPAGWSYDDDDIDEDDIDANIQRCKERIEDGIMPQMWETKLIKYQRWKEQLTAIIESEKEGLSLETVARIKNLEFIKQHLETKDEWGQLGNAIGILNAYRSGDLAWAHGLVTYWSDGKCLVEHPIPFEWDDVDKYKAICGDGALWVEGLNGPGPSPQYAYNSNPTYTAKVPVDGLHHSIDLRIRLPGSANGQSMSMRFVDDTGASVMQIFRDDLAALVDLPGGNTATCMGVQNFQSVLGQSVQALFRCELNIEWKEKQKLARPWVPCQCSVRDEDRPLNGPRLLGPWLRAMFYVGTCPNNENKLYISETHAGLARILPKADVKNARAPADIPLVAGGAIPPGLVVPRPNPAAARFPGLLGNLPPLMKP